MLGPQPESTTRATKEDGIKPEDMPIPDPIITLSNIIVRHYHPSDAEALARIANNKRIARNMTNRFPHPYSVEDGTKFIASHIPGSSGSMAGTAFAVILSSPEGVGGTFIGGCGLEPSPDVFGCSVELGYWFGEEFWGKGYATTVGRALVDWAFRQEDGVVTKGQRLLRIGAGVFSGNPASDRVVTNIGMKYEGCMRDAVVKWGEVRDLNVYGLTRGDWEKMVTQGDERATH